ncbi:MAG: hypothetical protein PHO53_05220, partial [Actinomycetota bacterium]|nr:hypothetical protein [Actinomycetota bacterium]
EVLKSDLFREIRLRQPYSSNLFRPCMIIDHPEVLREVVKATGAKPTHEGAETIINELADPLDELACEYGKLADEAWRNYSFGDYETFGPMFGESKAV